MRGVGNVSLTGKLAGEAVQARKLEEDTSSNSSTSYLACRRLLQNQGGLLRIYMRENMSYNSDMLEEYLKNVITAYRRQGPTNRKHQHISPGLEEHPRENLDGTAEN